MAAPSRPTEAEVQQILGKVLNAWKTEPGGEWINWTGERGADRPPKDIYGITFASPAPTNDNGDTRAPMYVIYFKFHADANDPRQAYYRDRLKALFVRYGLPVEEWKTAIGSPGLAFRAEDFAEWLRVAKMLEAAPVPSPLDGIPTPDPDGATGLHPLVTVRSLLEEARILRAKAQQLAAGAVLEEYRTRKSHREGYRLARLRDHLVEIRDQGDDPWSREKASEALADDDACALTKRLYLKARIQNVLCALREIKDKHRED